MTITQTSAPANTEFVSRHIGPRPSDVATMLQSLGYDSLEALIEEGVLTQEECDAADLSTAPGQVDYAKLYQNRYPLLRKAYERSDISKNPDYRAFLSLDPQEQSRRIMERNGPEMHQRFVTEWIPMENHYFEHYRIRESCD